MAEHRPTPLDAATFGALTEALRADLLVHCYRFMGAMTDAEDLVQETLAKAWRGRHTYRGEAGLRTWLRRIATRACLDALRARRGRRTLPSAADDPGRGEVLWLEPLPDDLLADVDSDPAATYDARESVSLAFLVALQRLPPRQRAALILRDVLALSAIEAAEHIDVSVSALNSLLHRARRTMRDRYAPPPSATVADAATARLLREYVRAWEQGDVDRLLTVIRHDAALEMPPIPHAAVGHAAIRAFLADGILDGTPGRWRGVTTGANGGPAAALYRLTDGVFEFTGVHLLNVRHGRIATMTAYMDPSLAARFNLPPRLGSGPSIGRAR